MEKRTCYNLLESCGYDHTLHASEFLNSRLAAIDKNFQDVELTHRVFVKSYFKPFAAVAYEYNKVSLSHATLGSKCQLSIPSFGDFFHDMCLHIVLEAPKTSVTNLTSKLTKADVPIYRWCDWPGERICQNTSLEIYRNSLDSYGSDAYNIHRQFKVSTDKMEGWHRMMGQETIQKGYNNYSDNASGKIPNSSRKVVKLLNGHQTYKEKHPDLELFIPLLFWFNTNSALSVPSVCLPYGQRFINFKLAEKEQLLRVICNPVSKNITNPIITTPKITKFDLYINNLFVQPDIHDIFIKRVGFQLIRTHKNMSTNVQKNKDCILLQSLNHCIETIYFGIRPTQNITSNLKNEYTDPNMEDWHRFSKINNINKPAGAIHGVNHPFNYKESHNHVTDIYLQSSGVMIKNNFPSQFYNSYIPYTYGKHKINTPVDPGVFAVNFNLYPGDYQPSGHFNTKQARELYLGYNSDYISSENTADLVINAVALDILILGDGVGHIM